MSSHQSSLQDAAVDPGTYEAPDWVRAWARYDPTDDERVPSEVGAIADGRREVPKSVVKNTDGIPVATGSYSTRLHAPVVVGDAMLCASRIEPDGIRHNDFEILHGFRELCSNPECSAYWNALEEGGLIER